MLENFKTFLWGPYTIGFLIILSFIILLKTKFKILNPRLLFGKTIFSIKDNPDAFSSMCLSLGGTIGVGNTIGIAGALRDGGPYTLIWMGFAGIIGMTIKFAEVYFAMSHKTKKKSNYGSICYVTEILGTKASGVIFALSAIAVSFGMGNLSQSKTAITAFTTDDKNAEIIIAVVLALTFFAVGFKGTKSIKAYSKIFVPLFSSIYVVLIIIIFFTKIEEFPKITKEMFSVNNVLLAIKWSAIKACITTSFTKSVFSSEAGMGSAGFSHSTTSNSPEAQGLWGAIEALVDTVICIITGVVLLLYWDKINALRISNMTSEVFRLSLGGFGKVMYGASMLVFAFSSIVCWYNIGQTSLSFITRKKQAKQIYLIVFTALIVLSSTIDIDPIVTYSEIANGIMMIINLTAISSLIFKNSLTF